MTDEEPYTHSRVSFQWLKELADFTDKHRISTVMIFIWIFSMNSSQIERNETLVSWSEIIHKLLSSEWVCFTELTKVFKISNISEFKYISSKCSRF